VAFPVVPAIPGHPVILVIRGPAIQDIRVPKGAAGILGFLVRANLGIQAIRGSRVFKDFLAVPATRASPG
jgi:hypothetical protein